MPRVTMGPGRIPPVEGDDKLTFKRFVLVALGAEVVFVVGVIAVALLR